MASYCAERERYGSKNFLAEEFNLYKEMLKNNLYTWSDEDYMQLVSFRNIVLVCLSLHELDWLQWFTDNYIDKIRPEYRENMKNLISANIKFARRSFEEALSYASKVKYDLFIYKIDVKNLMLKIYYELDLFEEAYYLIDTYRHYLSESSEMTEINKTHHMNFLNIYIKLLRAKSGSSIDELNLALSEITNMALVAARNWLIEKTNELTQKGAN